MDDEPQPSRAYSRFLMYLIEEYRREFATLPSMRDELCAPIAQWLLETETETERTRPN
jgi:phage gp36-like protein